MKNGIKIPLVLTLVCFFCVLIVSLLNIFTSKVISKYKDDSEVLGYKKLFENISLDKSIITKSDGVVNKTIVCKDEENNLLGYIVAASKKNCRGQIDMLCAFDIKKDLKTTYLVKNTQTPTYHEKINKFLKDTEGRKIPYITSNMCIVGATQSYTLLKEIFNEIYSKLDNL